MCFSQSIFKCKFAGPLAQWRVKIISIWVVGLFSPPLPSPSDDLGPKCLPSMIAGPLLAVQGSIFWASCWLSFFHYFFDAFLGRSWLRFPSQLASQNRSKSKKNRCQDAIHLGLRFLIDFWSIFTPNFDPQNLKNRAPAAARARFFKKSHFAIGIDFWSILVPTWLHFASQNPSKSFQKSIPRCIKFLFDFCIDF